MAIRPAIILSVLLTAAPALAGPVTGTVTVPAGAAGKPPLVGKAYLKRAENPLVTVKPVDPMPYLVVVLEQDGLTLPQGRVYQLEMRGASFDHPLLPVVAGSEVEIRNLKSSRRDPTLYVDGQPDLLPETPLNRGANRAFKVGTEAGKILVLKDKDAARVQSSIVVLSTPFFATPDADGKFAIPDVPKGKYRVKVWYRDGWLVQTFADLDVGEKGEKQNLDIKGLDVAGAAAEGAE